MFIAQTVTAPASEGGFVDGAFITSYFEIEDPDKADMGYFEAVSCSAQWSKSSDSGADIDVETFEFTPDAAGDWPEMVNFEGGPDSWCADDEASVDYVEGCKR